MELKVIESDGIHIMQFVGDLDGRSAPAAQDALVELIDRGATKLLIDFDELVFISSAGLRVLLVAAKRLQQAQGDIRVCRPNSAVMEVFEITGFDSIIPVLASREEAIEQF